MIGIGNAILTAAAALAAAPALAHTGVGAISGLAGGFSHPWAGLDHSLAMVAVGVYAAQLGGRALWALPAAFLAVMALGGAVGASGLVLAGGEWGIALSVLVFGTLIAGAARLPGAAAAVIVGSFAFFHGHAHGSEVAFAASLWAPAVGFLGATAFLHAVGLAAGLLGTRLRPSVVRVAGAAIAAAALPLALAS